MPGEGIMPSRTLVSRGTVKCCHWTIVLIFIMIDLTLSVALAAPQQHTRSVSDNTGSQLSQQNIQSILTSIDERLRSLDGVWSRARSSLDSHIHHTTRKLDMLDTRLERLEGNIMERLDALSTRLQEEEHATCTRSTHALHARIAAEHAAIACTNIQGHIDVQAAAADSAARAERWKSPVLKQTKNTKTFQMPISPRSSNGTHDQPFPTQIETRLRKLEEATNGRRHLMQQDAASAEELRAALSREATTIGVKLSNMYNELWRRSQSLETLVKDSMTLINATRRETQDGLKSLAMQLSRRGMQVHIPQQTTQDCNIDQGISRLMNFMHRKMANTTSKMEKEFRKISLAQNLFLDSCHKIQLNEPQFEAEITKVLEKLLDTFTNKTVTTFHELDLIQQLVKSHDSHIIQAVTKTNSIALTCSKNYETISENIDELKELYKKPHHRIDKEIVAILEDKVDSALTILQDLQDQFTYTESQDNEVDSASENNSILDNIRMEVQKAVRNISTDTTCINDKNSELMEKLVVHMQNLQETIDNLDEKDILTKYNMNDDDDDDYLESFGRNISEVITANQLIEKLKGINNEESVENDKEESLNEVQDEQKSTVKNKTKSNSGSHNANSNGNINHHRFRHSRRPHNKVEKDRDRDISSDSTKSDIEYEDDYFDT